MKLVAIQAFFMRQYLEIKIYPLSDAEQDILTAWLSDEKFYAFQKADDALLAYIEKEDYVESEFVTMVPEGKKTDIRIIEEEDWNSRWESDFRPVEFGDFLTIRAAFHQPIGKTKFEIVITPKMSFGTGHHATTSLMIRQMERLDFVGKSVIDFGTGTGILAILAAKMGAGHIVAIDKDDWCIDNAEENVAANGFAEIKVIKSSDLNLNLTAADIVLANITADVLLANASQLKGLTKPGGRLILSGFIEKDEGRILADFEDENFKKERYLTEEGWICIVFERVKNEQ